MRVVEDDGGGTFPVAVEADFAEVFLVVGKLFYFVVVLIVVKVEALCVREGLFTILWSR